MQWNPSAPDVLGVEFIPKGSGVLPGYRVAALVDGVAQRLNSTVSETVDALYAFVQPETSTGKFVAEVFEAGTETPAVTTTQVPINYVVPDGSNPTIPSTAPAILAILSQPSPPNPTQYIVPGTVGTDGFGVFVLNCGFATAGLFTGRRIVAVRCVMVVSDPSSKGVIIEGGEVDQLSPTFPNTRIPWGPPGQGFTPDATGPAIQGVVWDTGEIRPGSGSFWAPADLELFDVASPDVNGMTIDISVFGYDSQRMYQMYLEIDHCADTRLANDLVTPGNALLQWQTWTPHQPSPAVVSYNPRAANFAKVAGTDLTFLLRQPRPGGVDAQRIANAPADYRFTATYIEGFGNAPDPDLHPYGNVRLGTSGIISILGTETRTRVVGTAFKAGGASPDSQPYVSVLPVLLDGPHGAGVLTQGFSGAAAHQYGGVQIPVSYTGTPAVLTVALIRISDGMVLATGTLTKAVADQFPADATSGWRLVTVNFATPPTLAGATQYGVRLTATDATWTIPVLSARDIPNGTAVTGTGSYNGASDHAIMSGSDFYTDDFPFLLFSLVEPPTGLTVTPSVIVL